MRKVILIIIIKVRKKKKKKRRRKRMERTWQNFTKRAKTPLMMIFESPHTSERTSALSLDCSQNNARKNFFFVSSVFFVCGIEIFFGLFQSKTLFLIQKSS